MEYIAVGLIFLLGVFDGVICIFLFMNPHFFKEVLLVHIILYLVINRLENKFLDKYIGVPSYLALFLPGVGGVIVSILYFSLAYFLRDSMALDDYERYIDFNELLDHKEKIDYEKEMKTLSFLDQMNLMDTESKKELIIDFGMNPYEEKIKVLQKGLLDLDGEVKHYSAVTLNMLENEYIYGINHLREAFNSSKDINILEKMVESYKNYIESGLLSGEVLQVFNREYIEALKKLIQLRKETPELMHQLVRSYIRSGNFEQAKDVNTRLVQHYSERTDGLLNKIYMSYEKKEYKELNDYVKDFENENLKISQKTDELISFWKRKEETL